VEVGILTTILYGLLCGMLILYPINLIFPDLITVMLVDEECENYKTPPYITESIKSVTLGNIYYEYSRAMKN
jgi:hypothetical protein